MVKSMSKPYKEQLLPSINDTQIASYLVEASAANHYNRYYDTYYIKAEGEVDIAYTYKNKFWPVEIKWTQQLRPKDLKQIQKYPNGIILGKQNEIRQLDKVTSYPLPWYLARLDTELT